MSNLTGSFLYNGSEMARLCLTVILIVKRIKKENAVLFSPRNGFLEKFFFFSRENVKIIRGTSKIIYNEVTDLRKCKMVSTHL